MDRILSSSGDRWAIATPHTLASQHGAAAFEVGGNAVDAALTAAVTLTVVYPHNCTIGGDLFALVRRPDGTVVAVNGSGAAPGALRAQHVGADTMPERGPFTVTVPGVVRAWETLADLGARLDRASSIRPAIPHAADGVEVAPSLAEAIASADLVLSADEGLSELFVPGGKRLATGDLLRQPALARTLEAIAEGGADAFYQGRITDSLVATLNRAGSPMSGDDLAGHATEMTEPVAGRFRDLDVLVAPPNSQGFVLLEILAVIERLGLDPDPLGSDAPILAEIFRLASADRDRHLCDPRGMPVPLGDLLSDGNVERIAARARTRRASLEGTGWARPSGDTIALVAADAEGWAVSLIQSTFSSFGAGILDPGTGVLFHNRGACFSLDPRSPNLLEGGTRPAHTLMPLLAHRDGALATVSGTMGGGAQPQINAQALLRLFDLGMDPGVVLDAPRWVVGGLDVDSSSEVIHAEARVPDATLDAFRRTGFEVLPLQEWDEGVGHAHLIGVRGGTFDVATDPRADGSAFAG